MTAVTVNYGSNYTAPGSTFTPPAGSMFSGWNTAANGGGTSYAVGASVLNVVANITLYAIWTPAWTISFNANGGTGSMTAATVVNGSGYTIPANTFNWTNHAFMRWDTSPAGTGTSYAAGANIASVTANITLYAIWQIDSCTITFNGNGATAGSMTSGTVAYGGDYTIPANAFSRTGYTFLRWNTSSAGNGTNYAAGAEIPDVTSNITLYAIWQITTRAISFNPVSSSGSGTGTMTAVTVDYGSNYTTPVCTFSPPAGYSFSRWNTLASGLGFSYNPGEQVPNVTANTTLYAIWQINTYTVTFNANGGTGIMTNGTVNYGGNYTVPVNSFTRTGYTYQRWNTQAAGGGTNYSAGEIISGVTSNVTLYAIWQITTMTISFNPVSSTGTGTGSMSSVQVNYGSSYTTPACTFTSPAGHSFYRWNTAANGSGTSYAAGANIASVTANTTLYALWQINTYTITFNGNGSTGGSMTSGTATYGSSYAIPANAFTRTNYTFVRWDTNAAGDGTSYAIGTSIANVTNNITLYAIWQASTRTITFDGNGATGGSMTTGTVTYGSNYPIPANAFTRTNSVFVRWDTNAAGDGTSYAAGATIENVTANITLYAIWDLETIMFMDFNGGQTVSQLFETVVDPDNTVTIQSTIALSGSAMRLNQAAAHRLDLRLGETGYQDFWVMFDFYLESADTLAAMTFTPLLMLIDSSTDINPGITTPKLIGTPLFNYYTADTPIVGYNRLYPLTNVLSQNAAYQNSISDRVAYPTAVGSVVAGQWINIKMHIKMDNATNGMDLYINKTQLTNPRIATGDVPEIIHFDMLRLWYHAEGGTPVQVAPNTNIYFDNIGVYMTDPDL